MLVPATSFLIPMPYNSTMHQNINIWEKMMMTNERIDFKIFCFLLFLSLSVLIRSKIVHFFVCLFIVEWKLCMSTGYRCLDKNKIIEIDAVVMEFMLKTSIFLNLLMSFNKLNVARVDFHYLLLLYKTRFFQRILASIWIIHPVIIALFL